MSDVGISGLPEASALTGDDLLVLVDDLAGTPTTKRITAANAASYFTGGSGGTVVPVAGTDLAALEAAVAAASAGDTVRGSPGTTYTHDDVWTIAKAGITLDFRGCIIVATVETASAVIISGDDVALLGGIWRTSGITARGGALEDHRLVLSECARSRIVGARVESSRATGIFVTSATRFEVTVCTVIGTHADTIHVTAASTHGLILRPRCYRGGDDGVAVVSYAGNVDPCTDIAIVDALVWDQISGRGITVVGGERIDIVNPDVRRSWGAGIYLANEPEAGGPGQPSLEVDDVTVHGGRLVACNYEDSIDHGSIFVLSGIDGGQVANVLVESVEVVDAGRQGIAPAAAQVKDGGSTGTVANVVLGTADGPIRLTGIYRGDISIDGDLVGGVASSFIEEPQSPVINFHGSNASAPRLAGDVNYWIGTVEPTNADDGDIWVDVT